MAAVPSGSSAGLISSGSLCGLSWNFSAPLLVCVQLAQPCLQVSLNMLCACGWSAKYTVRTTCAGADARRQGALLACVYNIAVHIVCQGASPC